MRGQFKIHSLERIGTLSQDIDVGVVRVPGIFLKRYAKRNSLVRISMINDAGKKTKTIIRIVRAATGGKALRKNEIALQYDDRIELGIRKAGEMHTIEIESVSDWSGIWRFLLGHPSPLVRREVVFSIVLMIFGALVGFLIGLVV